MMQKTRLMTRMGESMTEGKSPSSGHAKMTDMNGERRRRGGEQGRDPRLGGGVGAGAEAGEGARAGAGASDATEGGRGVAARSGDQQTETEPGPGADQ